jgi:hypothetical protein
MSEALTPDDRLKKIEDQLKAPKQKDAWDKVQAIAPAVATVLSGTLVAVVGYYLTGTLNASLQRQQMQLANVKEMREQLQVLGSDRPEPGALRAAAFTLSAYGAPAAPPLFAALVEEDLHSHGDGRSEAMLDALRAIGLSEPAPVCERAARIVDSHHGRYSWETHFALIRLIGDLECTSAAATVQRYGALVPGLTREGLEKYKRAVAENPAPDLDSVRQIQAELARTAQLVTHPR